MLVSSGQGSPDDEAELLPSLADLSPPDTHYQSVTVAANQLGQFGITLRHFSIQPDNLPVSGTGECVTALLLISSPSAAYTKHTAEREMTIVWVTVAIASAAVHCPRQSLTINSYRGEGEHGNETWEGQSK